MGLYIYTEHIRVHSVIKTITDNHVQSPSTLQGVVFVCFQPLTLLKLYTNLPPVRTGSNLFRTGSAILQVLEPWTGPMVQFSLLPEP
jgi:hypothetical protein